MIEHVFCHEFVEFFKQERGFGDELRFVNRSIRDIHKSITIDSPTEIGFEAKVRPGGTYQTAFCQKVVACARENIIEAFTAGLDEVYLGIYDDWTMEKCKTFYKMVDSTMSLSPSEISYWDHIEEFYILFGKPKWLFVWRNKLITREFLDALLLGGVGQKIGLTKETFDLLETFEIYLSRAECILIINSLRQANNDLILLDKGKRLEDLHGMFSISLDSRMPINKVLSLSGFKIEDDKMYKKLTKLVQKEKEYSVRRDLGQNMTERELAIFTIPALKTFIDFESPVILEEAGMGLGGLIEELEDTCDILGIELDNDLYILLQDKYKGFNNIKIRNEDMMNVNNYEEIVKYNSYLSRMNPPHVDLNISTIIHKLFPSGQRRKLKQSGGEFSEFLKKNYPDLDDLYEYAIARQIYYARRIIEEKQLTDMYISWFIPDTFLAGKGRSSSLKLRKDFCDLFEILSPPMATSGYLYDASKGNCVDYIVGKLKK